MPHVDKQEAILAPAAMVRMSGAVLDEHRIEHARGCLPLEPEVSGESIQESALGWFLK
jgi:hypothetical protein